jgi:hypothetical protein
MIMKKIFSAIIMAFVATIACHAQMSQEEIIDSYVADVNESVQTMMGTSQPWNRGESFVSFIAKFSTDAEFMKSRTKLSAEQQTQFAHLLVPSNFEAQTPFEKEGNDDSKFFYQMWGEMQFSTVHLDCGWVDSYYSHTFEFKRVGGKWHLTKIVPGE